MRKFLARTGLVTAGIVAYSCSSPTYGCACGPALTAAVVKGSVIDAKGAPVSGARIYFDGVRAGQEGEKFQLVEASQTDATGHFTTTAFSNFGEGVLQLRAAVIPSASKDTIRIAAGTATFGYSNAQDTVRLDLRLP